MASVCKLRQEERVWFLTSVTVSLVHYCSDFLMRNPTHFSEWDLLAQRLDSFSSQMAHCYFFLKHSIYSIY